VVSLDDGSLAELWLRSLSATFVAGRKIMHYSIFSFLTAIKLVSHAKNEKEKKKTEWEQVRKRIKVMKKICRTETGY
jgi:hypothetical protein